jgi:membrane protein YdbS with pleckstrin-like domain
LRKCAAVQAATEPTTVEPVSTPAAADPGDPGAPEIPVPRPLAGDDPADRHQLPIRVVAYWRIRALLTAMAGGAVILAAAVVLRWPSAPVRWALAGVVLVYLIAGLTAIPVIRRRIFWYAVDADEIEIQRGLFVVSRSVVPMTRVQHLKTEQGPLADRFRLAALHIHTAAGTVEMHGLDAAEAADLRVRIGRLANLADDV